MKKFILGIIICFICTSYAFAQNEVDSTKFYNSVFDNAKELENNGKFEEAFVLFKKINDYFVKSGNEDNLLNANSLHKMGKCLLSLDRMDGIVYAQKALDLRKKLLGTKNVDYINSLNNVAQYYYGNKDYAKALELQQNVLELCEKIHPEHPNKGMFKINLAKIYLEMGDKIKAKELFSAELVNLKNKYGNKSKDYSNMILWIGCWYYLCGDKAEAVKYYEQLLDIYTPYSDEYGKMLEKIGCIYIDLNDSSNVLKYQKLIDAYNEKELTKECNEPECMIERASLYALKDELAKAKDCFLKAMAMCKNPKTTFEEKIKVDSAYAQFLYDTKDFENAATYYELVASEMKNRKDYALTRITPLLYAGISYSFVKDYNKSISCLKEACLLINGKEEKFAKTYSFLLGLLGNNYFAINDYDEALKYYNEKLNFCEKIGGETEDLADALRSVALMQVIQNKYDLAETNYKRAAGIYKNLKNDYKYNNVLAELNICSKKSSNKELEHESKALIDQTVDVSETILKEEMSNLNVYKLLYGEDGLEYANVLNLISTINYVKGRTGEALEFANKFMKSERAGIRNNFRLLGADDRNKIWNENIEKMDTLMLQGFHSLGQPDTAIVNGYARLAYDVQLLSKGILLNSYVEFEKVLKNSADNTLLAKFETIKKNEEAISRLASQLTGERDNEKLDEIRRIKLENERLQVDLMKKNAEYGDYTKYLSLSWKDVQNSLKDDALAVEFARIKTGFLDEDATYVALLLKKGWTSPKMIKLFSQKELYRMESDSTMYQKKDLGNMIWAPMESYLTNIKSIYFSPDADLYQISIEYLPYKDKYFYDTYNAYRMSSTKELAMNRESIAYNKAVLFGDLDYGDYKQQEKMTTSNFREMGGNIYFCQLPGSKFEVENIKKSLSKKDIATTIYSGKAGDNKAFNSISGTGVNILHIATHGECLEGEVKDVGSAMDASILALSGANDVLNPLGGVVSASDISKMDLRKCDLVVLSACKSGNGSVFNDGVFGLQRGFKNAGARTIVMSLWRVDDKATSLLMSKFYEYLALGTQKYESFIKAQNYIRNNGYKSSKDWGAFIMLDGM